MTDAQKKENRVLRKIHAEILIHAATERVFRAWTDSNELSRWFSEHADVSLDENRYQFWGRYQPDAPSRNSLQQELLAVEPDTRLRFAWRVYDAGSTVEMTLEPRGALTFVSVGHEWLPESDATMQAAMLEAFWSLSLENLRAWVERGVVGARNDFTTKPLEQVQLEVDINADPEAVFQALVDPDQLDRYIASGATVQPEVGGLYDFGWAEHAPMKILELEPNRRLSHTWSYEGDDHARDTIVTWTLDGGNGKTRLTLVHSGFAPERGSGDYQIGWLDFLNRIKFMVEVGSEWVKPNSYGVHRENEPLDEPVFIPSAGVSQTAKSTVTEERGRRAL